MRKCDITLCIFLLFVLCVTHSYSPPVYKHKEKSTEFDVLIFSQRWPPTACFVWKENSESHSCSLPKHNQWTIHGIWPTRYNDMGPQYCNKLPFNKTALEPIMKDLCEKWIDIHNGSKPASFWEHEWKKHGTCAIIIKGLDNELKYFQMGLKLHDDYNMIDVLAKANIISGRRYTVQSIFQAIKKILGKTAQVTCTEDEKTGESYLFEIRICFDKTLQLIDCDGIYNFPTNCDKSELIRYPGHVPHNYYVKQV